MLYHICMFGCRYAHGCVWCLVNGRVIHGTRLHPLI